MHDEDEWYNRVQDLPRYQPDLLGGSDSKEKKPKKKWTSDTSTANGSSIAFLASFEGKSCLFSGDAHSPDLQKAIETHFELKKGECISVDAWKLSHHGSKRNTETGLMDRVMAKNILVTTSGKKFDHPDEEAIDALLEYEDRPLTLCFNYKSEFNEKYAEQNLQHDLDYTAIYPKKNGTAVSIEL